MCSFLDLHDCQCNCVASQKVVGESACGSSWLARSSIMHDGRKEPVMFDKITSRIQKLCYGLNMDYIDPPSITLKVISGLYSGVSTVELDNLAAETAVMLSNEHPDYAILAARIEISNLHKETKKSFSEVVENLHKAGKSDGTRHPKMDDRFYDIVKRNEEVLNSSIIYDRDFSYSYFGIKVLENKYLKKINRKVVERPQHMFMRIAVAIHEDDVNAAIETYNMLSGKWYMHNVSTMSNAGFTKVQLFSDCCFTMKSDSIEGIYDTVRDFGFLTRSGVTTGLSVHCIRAKGSYIAGTNGNSNGLVPMLRVYNSTAKGIHQGRSKEVAALTIYLEPWHGDIFDFLSLKKTSGMEEQRARSLSYALWIPDLFMKRVRENGDWCLMCPHDSEELQNLWGDEFEERYIKFEREGRYNRKIKARQLWDAIYESQVETGGPSMFYKDNCNLKSNHKNIGTLLSSSYTGGLMTYTSSNEASACGSGIICIDMFVQSDRTFDFGKLRECVKVVTKTLNKMIDVNQYPIEECRIASQRHRPIAVGIQGLADAFILMRYPFESEEAKMLNKQIFETIYYGAMETSCELAEKFGPYETYEGSPVSKGIFQYDMWDITPTPLHDWSFLKERVAKFGVRNSLLVACIPSPVTAQIQGCNEGTEAYLSNCQRRTVFEGSMKVINRHLLKDLTELGLWDNEIEALIKENDGSLENVERVPDNLKMLYKTVWEIPQKKILEMAVDRGAFIDQSQSLIVRMIDPNYAKFTSMHFFAWKSGLKTGMMKLQSKNVVSSVKAATSSKTFEKEAANEKENGINGETESAMLCSLNNKEDCLACVS